MRAEVGSASSGRSRAVPRHRGGAIEDGEFLRRVRAGERDAFAALVARHGGPLLRFARLLADDDVAASALVQDAWLAVLHAEGGLDERAAFRTWLFRILVARAKRRAMRNGRAAQFSAAAEPTAHERTVEPERFDARGMWAHPPAKWTEDTPEGLARERETRAVIEAAVDELTPGQKAVLVLHDAEGLETDEIRDLLDIAVPDQRVLLHRARTHVARALEVHARGVREVGSILARRGSEGPSAAPASTEGA